MNRLRLGLVALVALLASVLVVAQPLSAASSQHYNFTGGQLGANWGDADTSAYISIDTSKTFAFLHFEKFSCDGTGACRGVIMNGPIPPDVVRLTPAIATMNATLAASDAFTIQDYTCSFDADYNYICTFTDRASGTINLTWKKQGPITYRQSGLVQVKTPVYTMNSNGDSTYTDATVTGSVLEFSVPSNAFGTIGTITNVSITITKN